MFNLQTAQFTRRMSEINKQNIKAYWEKSPNKSRVPRKTEEISRNLDLLGRLKGSKSPAGTQGSSPCKTAASKCGKRVDLNQSAEKNNVFALKKSLTGLPRYGLDKLNSKKLSIESLKDFSA